MEATAVEEDVAEAVISLLLMRGRKIFVSEIGTRNEKTSKELCFLENVFMVSSYPDGRTKQILSILLGLSQKTIQIWFQNRRRCLKSTVKRQVLVSKNNFNGLKLSNERLYRKMCVDSQFFAQKSVSSAVIVKTYCGTFGISWGFA